MGTRYQKMVRGLRSLCTVLQWQLRVCYMPRSLSVVGVEPWLGPLGKASIHTLEVTSAHLRKRRLWIFLSLFFSHGEVFSQIGGLPDSIGNCFIVPSQPSQESSSTIRYNPNKSHRTCLRPRGHPRGRPSIHRNHGYGLSCTPVPYAGAGREHLPPKGPLGGYIWG